MDKFKTNWQLTETVKPEDFNRIEGNIKENDTNISNLRTYSDQTFLNKNGKAKDSDKLDGIDSANFVSGSNQTKTEDTSGGGFDKTHSGFQRHNGNGLSGSLAMNIAHPGYQDGKYARGLTFNYGGDGFGVSTYAFGTQGENLGYAKIYTDKDKPTPNEIGAVSKEGDNLNGSLVFKNDTGLQSKDSENNNRDMIRLNKSNQLVLGYNGQVSAPVIYKGNQAYEIYHKGNKPTTDEIGAKNKEFPDTREENKSPKWYFENYPRQEITEFKYGKSLGLFPADNYSYGTLTTYVPWNGNSGGYPVQIFRSETSATYTRTTNNNDTWLAWRKVYDSENKPTPSEIGAVASGQKIIPNKVGAAETWIGLNGENSTYISNVNGNSEKSYIRLNGNGIVETNKGEIYTKGNKPTPSEIGAVSKSGDDISGTLKFRSQGNEIEIFNNSSSQQARGIVYKNNSNVITGMVGSLLNGQNSEKMFIGNTSEPWSGVNSLTVDKSGCYYNNQKIYHKGNKPTPGEIGAVSTVDISQEIVANKVVQRDSNGDIKGRLLRSNYQDENYVKGAIAFRTNNSDDNYTRYCNNPTALKQWLGFGQWDFNTRDLKVHNKRAMVGLDNNDGNKLCINYNEDFENVDISGKITLGGMRVGNGYENGYRKSIPVVAVDGVMEVGRFIDFHSTTKEKDYDVRMECAGPNDLRTSGSFSAVGGDIYAYKGGSGNTKAAILGTGDMDIFVCNLKSKKYLQLKDDGRLCYSDTKIQLEPNQGTLWSGVQYMGSGQSAWPSKHLMDCQNGWILVWSDYDQGPNNANDYNWCYSYIPKNSPANGKTQNQFFQVSTNENGDMTVKGLIIYNNRIDGVDPTGNAQSSGKWHDVVLRYILEY